jgi:hypothetical protein
MMPRVDSARPPLEWALPAAAAAAALAGIVATVVVPYPGLLGSCDGDIAKTRADIEHWREVWRWLGTLGTLVIAGSLLAWRRADRLSIAVAVLLAFAIPAGWATDVPDPVLYPLAAGIPGGAIWLVCVITAPFGPAVAIALLIWAGRRWPGPVLFTAAITAWLGLAAGTAFMTEHTLC